MIVNCLHPKTIFNPASKMYLAKYRFYTCQGIQQEITDKQLYCLFQGASYKQVIPNITHYDYVIDFSSGECFPFFVDVPCRTCACCRYVLASSYIQRAEFASYEETELPIFVTLTYNNRHLPDNNLLNLKDIQNFKKRLSKCFPLFRIKYMVFGEYGHINGRPHFHMLIFGLPLSKLSSNFNCQIAELKKRINYCWRDTSRGYGGEDFSTFLSHHYPLFADYNVDPYSFGHTDVKPCLNSLPIAYCCKYITKQLTADDNRPYFRSCSKNLGLKFAASHVEFALRSHDGRFLVSSNGKCRFVAFTRYYLNHLFPSFCMSISCDLRNSVRTFIGLFNTVKNRLSPIQVELSNKIFNRFSQIADFDYTINSSADLMPDFLSLLDTLLLTPIPNLSMAVQADENRKFLLARMFANSNLNPHDYLMHKNNIYAKIIIKDCQ